MIIYSALALLFQLFFKIALGRELWNVVDVGAMKFQSCLTLFALVAPEYELIKTALERFYNG